MISPRNAFRRGLLGVGCAGFALVAVFSLSLRAADDAPRPATARAASAAKAAEPTEKKAEPGKVAEGDKQTSVWMRKKLDYSQNILAGITAGDFELVSQNANAMKGLAKIESFVRGRSPGYRAQLQIFQEANEELLRQARKENADGAALAFTQLTVSCVNCHKQLRETEKK